MTQKFSAQQQEFIAMIASEVAAIIEPKIEKSYEDNLKLMTELNITMEKNIKSQMKDQYVRKEENTVPANKDAQDMSSNDRVWMRPLCKELRQKLDGDIFFRGIVHVANFQFSDVVR